MHQLRAQYKKNFSPQGLNHREEIKLINEAKNIEDAGAFAIVLECVNASLARKITKNLQIPTIGIGSSKYCDGQILVLDDLIGLSGFYPKFVKKYIDLFNYEELLELHNILEKDDDLIFKWYLSHTLYIAL